MLALTRLRDFMIERGIMEVSMPVYDPKSGKLSPRELYATRGLRRNRDNGTPTQEILLEYRLSNGWTTEVSSWDTCGS